MKITLKNILAVMAGFLVGSSVNMGLIILGSVLVPLPAGIDATNVDSLKEGMHLFELKHFIFPWLAHALGTLVGAAVAAWLTVSNKKAFAYGIGVFFMLGGITNAIMLPSPLWFVIVDVVFAYLPMAWLGYRFVSR